MNLERTLMLVNVFRKQLIEEERITILQEYATKLGGVFPRGVLRESDREKLNF